VLGNNIGKGGNTALGAIIGGVVGGAAGGIIGNRMDKQAQKIETALPGAQVERVVKVLNLPLAKTL
jgi:outer membrane lipoprotein SlyB